MAEGDEEAENGEQPKLGIRSQRPSMRNPPVIKTLFSNLIGKIATTPHLKTPKTFHLLHLTLGYYKVVPIEKLSSKLVHAKAS